MTQERLPKQTLYAEVSRKRPVRRPRIKRFDYIKDLGWNRSGLHPREMLSTLVNRKVWWLKLELLSHATLKEKQVRKKMKKMFLKSPNKFSCELISSAAESNHLTPD